MRRNDVEVSEIQEFVGLEDLKETEEQELEDRDLELSHTAFHFYPEAYGERDWVKELRDSTVNPMELE